MERCAQGLFKAQAASFASFPSGSFDGSIARPPRSGNEATRRDSVDPRSSSSIFQVSGASRQNGSRSFDQNPNPVVSRRRLAD